MDRTSSRRGAEKPRLYVGIDPGSNGGMATIAAGEMYASAYSLPHDDPETLMDFMLERWNPRLYCGVTVYMEKVGGYIKAGKGAGGEQPGSSMFRFGQGYGILQMAVVATAGRLPREVTPQDWQKYMDVTPRGRFETKTQFKNRLKTLATPYLRPGDKMTLSKADAVLIAVYARRRHEPSPS